LTVLFVETALAEDRVTLDQNFGEWRVVLSVSDAPALVYNNQHGKLKLFSNRQTKPLIELSGGEFSIFDDAPSSQIKADTVPFAKDLEGDGKPELLFIERSSGLDCCTKLNVLRATNNGVRLATAVDLGFSKNPSFRPRSQGKGLLLSAEDYSFGGWGGKGLNQPSVAVVLEFVGDKFRLFWPMMRKEAPSEQELLAQAQKVKAELSQQPEAHTDRDLPLSLVENWLKLRYSDNLSAADRFLRLAWPEKRPGLDRYRTQLEQQLKQNPLWSEPSSRS
jgi:hypothetical protein